MSTSLAERWQSLEACYKELESRRQARRSLLDFTLYTNPVYRPDPFHHLLAGALDEVVEGRCDRLMIFAPPQHGKSELTSVRLPPYYLGRHPDMPVLLCSYSGSLAGDKSKQAREVMEGADYANLFPVSTRKDSRASDYWLVEGKVEDAQGRPHRARGSMRASGVGGSITGRGAKLGIIDDPVANWEEAQSDVIRENIWMWYVSTFRTRIWEGGAIVLIMTRWHEDDLAGRLLTKEPGRWRVLRLPALAESQEERDQAAKETGQPLGQPDPLGRQPGEPLAPGRFSQGHLEATSQDVGGMIWSAEYQGTPRAAGGNMFKPALVQLVDASPSRLHWVRYWDKAGTEGGGAYSAGVLMGYDPREKLVYVEDVRRGQWAYAERENLIKQTAALDKEQYGLVRIWLEEEGGSGGLESAQRTVKELIGYAAQRERVTGSKEVRAIPWATYWGQGNVRVKRAGWTRAYLDEHAGFPRGRYKDQVDASSGAFAHVTQGGVYFG